MAIVAPENTRAGARHPGRARRRPPGSAARAAHAVPDGREAVGRLLLPDRRGGPGRGSAAPCLRGLPLRRGPDRLARAAREDGADRGALRPRRSRCGSSAPRPTSRSASRAARARSTRSAPTCRAARSSTHLSRTRPKGSSAIRSTRPATSATRSRGVRLRFEGGRIVDASATSDEEFLLGALDTDEGARRLGEFGIGCNPGIQRHMRNTLFDEKMEGTIHLAIGTGLPADRRHEHERDPLGHGQGAPERRPDRARRQGRPGKRRMGAFVDPRVEQYARLLVDRSLGVQPGWQVMVVRHAVSRGPLVEELVRQIGRQGRLAARPAFVRRPGAGAVRQPLGDRGAGGACSGTMAPIEARTREELDAWILIFGSENTRGGTILAPPTGAQKLRQAYVAFDAAAARHRDALGRLPLPDRGARAGGRHDARRLRRLRLRRLPPRLGRASASACSRYADRFDAADDGAHRRPRHRSDAVDRRARAASSTTPTTTCRAASSSTRRSRTRRRA